MGGSRCHNHMTTQENIMSSNQNSAFGFSKYIAWCSLLFSLFVAQVSFAQTWTAAYFRGTPNAFNSTAMTYNTTTGLWETTQNFAGVANPRFKISRYNTNWNEAYPAADYLVTGGDGDYKITFNDNSKAITLTKLPVVISANSICFNNPNAWATPTMYFWNPTPAGSVNPLPAWPGVALTKQGNYYCLDMTSRLVSGAMPVNLNIIFSNNGATQTANLTYGNALACYENGVWKSLTQCGFTTVAASSSAAASSTPASSTPASSTPASSVASSAGLSVTSTTVCYDNAAAYATPYVYYWNPNPAGSVTASPAWPGRLMTQKGTFYCLDFAPYLATAGTMPTTMGIKFSNNGNPQTADMTFTNPNACYQGGAWKTLAACGFTVTTTSSSAASSVAASSVASSVAASSVASSVAPTKTRIYLKNTPTPNYATPYMHYYNVVPALAASTWPGVAMVNKGNGWYYYEFTTTVTSAGIVFSNNGAPQTANLTFTAPNNCYSNGAWTTAAACGAPADVTANAGVDRTVNVNTRQALSAVASIGTYATATWTSPAWTGTLTGTQVVTPVLTTTGTYTVTLTLTTADNQTFTDTMVMTVVAATQGLPARPQLAAPLGFPITGNVNAGAYRFVKAFPALDGLFPSPVMMTNDGVNDLIYVVDKVGTISVFPNRENVALTEVKKILDIQGVVRNFHEAGLLSVAFDPNYSSNGFFYIYYVYGTTDNEKDANGLYGDTVLERWTVDNPFNPTTASGKVELLRVPQPGPDHKGSMMKFHPSEGYLYLSIGDGAYGHSAITSYAVDPRTNNSAQDTTNLRGSFIRIKPLATPVNGKYYEVPADNPFVGMAGFKPEIWSYGHRNPWRWDFDKEAPYTLWETEIGQQGYEEVNLIKKGKNYGWPVCEGVTNRGDLGGNPTKNCSMDYEPPRDGYGRASGVSIIGGVVYRGNTLPNLKGSFVFGDYVSKRIWAIKDDGAAKTVISEAFPGNIASFGTDKSGDTLLISTYQVEYGGTAAIYKMLDDNAAAAQIPPKLSQTGLFADVAGLIPSTGVIEYDVNTKGWFDGAITRHFVAVPNDKTIGFDVNGVWDLPVGSVLVKHQSIATASNPNKPFTTSVLFRQEAGWQAANYYWNAAGTDADLVTTALNVTDSGTVNRQRIVQSGTDCGACHIGSGSKNPLGVHTRQLNANFNYQGVTGNQLNVFNSIGMFTGGINNASTYAKFAAPTDATADLTLRAKSYMATNCAHCHSSTFMDMRFDTALADMHLIGVGGTGTTRRIKPFDYANSMVYIYQTTDGNRMPKGSFYTNPEASSLFQEWITGATAVQNNLRVTSASKAVDVNGTISLTAEAMYSNGFYAPATGTVTWASTDPSILSTSGASGTTVSLTGLADGVVTVTAQSGGYSASIEITVGTPVQPITSIEIAPTTITLTGTQQLVALGKAADGTRSNIYGLVTWSMQSGGTVASVSATGLLTRLTSGTAVVKATYNGLTATANITSTTPGLAIRYSNPNGWANVYVHLWRSVNGVDTPIAPWPGILLNDSDGDGWWSYLVESQYLNNGTINVIFNNGAGAQTTNQLNIAQSSSYNGTAWTAWNAGNMNNGALSRLSVIAATTANNLRDFPVGTVVTVTANEAPYGTTFHGWSGDALPYVFSNPESTVIQLVIPDHALTLQALFTGGDDYASARSLFASQCAGCHGVNGVGGVGGTLNTLHTNNAWTIPMLASYINDFMPKGAATQCVGTSPGDCAYDIANMIMNNGWVAECSGSACQVGTSLDARNLRLLTREEYLNSVRDIFGINFAETVIAGVPADGRVRNYNTASFLVMTSDRNLGYQTAAQDIANQAITTKGFMGLVTGCSDVNCVVTKLGEKLFRRQLNITEVTKYAALYTTSDAGRTVVQGMLMSPNFLYRSEMGVLDSATGLYKLTNYEIATLLSYSFWVTTPDDIMLAAAASTNFDIEAQVNRLLADTTKAERGLRRFAQGWLINNQYPFPGISSATLVESFKEETIRFVMESIKANKPFNTMLTANYTYANTELAAYYGMTAVPANTWQQAYYPTTDARSGGTGLLGHGSFLASRSHTTKPSVIKRGVFVREALMCQEFPPPAAANFNIVVMPTDSNRDATSRHTSDPACQGCHQYIDGVGFGFERLGSNALLRATETLGDGTSRVVDASGAIKSLYSPETTMDPNSPAIAYNTLPELANLIANSGLGAACYSRQFYRYMIGRNEAASDEPIIRSYSTDVRGGGGMRDMLVDLTLANSFIMRR